MQPTPTSAHRRPPVHIPEDLNNCSHVFVLRGGVQPTLTTPYDGPYRVIDRTPNGFRIEFPGRPSDIVALARLRPAIMSPGDNQGERDIQQDLDDAAPPSPPPPGRRPGVRTRVPQPTDRVTRSAAAQRPADPEPSFPENEPIPCSSRSVPEPPAEIQPSDSNHGAPGETASQDPTETNPVAEETCLTSGQDPAMPDSSPASPRSHVTPTVPVRARVFTSREERTFSNRGGPVPVPAPEQPSQRPAAATQHQGGVPVRRRVLSFSKPQPGNFSHRRRRPDVSALNAVIQSYLS